MALTRRQSLLITAAGLAIAIFLAWGLNDSHAEEFSPVDVNIVALGIVDEQDHRVMIDYEVKNESDREVMFNLWIVADGYQIKPWSGFLVPSQILGTSWCFPISNRLAQKCGGKWAGTLAPGGTYQIKQTIDLSWDGEENSLQVDLYVEGLDSPQTVLLGRRLPSNVSPQARRPLIVRQIAPR